MRPLFEPRLVNDAFGDPGLYVDFRDERRALLFDFGDVSGLPPRKLLRISDIYISHTHVDHFVGFDHWLRVVLGRKEHATLTGGPGFINSVEHKLAAYTWNVVHRYEVPLTLAVHEVTPEGASRQATFCSRNRFAREDGEPWMSHGDVLHSEEGFRVRGRFLDHDILCLAFALEEATHVNVWKNRLAEWGLPTGHWLREARRALAAGAPDDTAIAIEWHDSSGAHALTRTLGELRPAFDPRARPPHRLRHRHSLHRGQRPGAGGIARRCRPPLHRECVPSGRGRPRGAQEPFDGAAGGSIARRVRAKAVVPFHFSPRYEGRDADVVAEMQAAWNGAGAGVGSPSR